MKCIACPGTDADTDHNLLILKSRLKWKNLKKSKRRPHWNLNQLENKESKTEYQK